MVCLSVSLGMGEVCVLLSMGILFKFLIHRFVNRVTVVDIKFIHMYFLFTGEEYVVFFKTMQNSVILRIPGSRIRFQILRC
jgi:hypothetical protein